MLDLVLIDGDKVIFIPIFGPAIVAVKPGKLEASGPATITGKKICVDGDEKKVAVRGCSYMTPQYCIPGSGTLKIAALAVNQKAIKTYTGKKKMLLKGGNFIAKFEVQSPAKQPAPPAPPIPDPTPQYPGTGMFIPANTKVMAT